MNIVPLHEKLEKLCFRSTGDVVMLQDGSGPWIVTLFSGSVAKPTGSSGLYEYGMDRTILVHLQDGLRRTESLSTRATFYPKAEVHLGKGQ